MTGPSKVTVLPEVLARRVELLDQLEVSPSLEGGLVVDVSAFAPDDKVWRLRLIGAGTWGHDESQLCGRLGHVLYAIAASYEPGPDDAWEGPACRLCGCTDDAACPGGCAWVDDPAGEGDLCSACLHIALADAARPKLTPARRRVIEVLVRGAHVGRPVRSSDHTTDLAAELPPAAPLDLCVHQRVIGGLEELGLVERVDRLSFYYRLTAAGAALAELEGLLS